MKSSLLIICFTLVYSCASINCNATHFDFTSKYTLGKQDELNKTFEKIQQKITSLDNVTYNATQEISFTISNVNPSFYYRDSKQKAKITEGNLIIVDGGYLQVDFTFNWQKTYVGTQNGTGAARGLSFQIIFAKQMIVDSGFYSFELMDTMPITFPDNGTAFELTRIDPPTIPDSDRSLILQMLNLIKLNKTLKTVRLELQIEISKYYSYYLNQSLHSEHLPIDLQFDYKWQPDTVGKNNVTISLLRRPITIDVEKVGVQTTFEVQVENDTNWKCGNRTLPISPFDHLSYGGSQQFISYDFYQNIIRYAINNNILDTVLNKANWESRMFQFYAGDLYEVFTKFQTKFFANAEVGGNCKASSDKLKVQQAQKDMFRVFIHYDCALAIQKEKIVDFGLDLNLTVGGLPTTSSIDFKLKSHQSTIKIYPYGQYGLANQQLAITLIRSCLHRLYQGRLFGSGFPTYPPRDYPIFQAQTNSTIIYDPTHINM